MPRPPLDVSPDRITPFGHRLISACRDRGLSLVGLSREVGWSDGRCSQLIRARRADRTTVERMARVLGIDRSVLDPELTSIDVTD
jgi:hypothetical protein